MGTFLQDFRYALRQFRRAPGFAAVAALTLALGIGANTAVFSVVNGVLLQPLRYRHPERIVALNSYWKQSGHTTPRLAGGDMMDLRSQAQSFDAFSYYHGGEMGVQVAGQAEFTGAFLVSAGFFRVFDVVPEQGRVFDDREADRSAVVGAAFAQRHFGSAANAVGRVISIEQVPYEIAGVLPAGFQFPQKAEVWASAAFLPSNRNRTGYNYPAVGRLKAGVTLEQAQSELDTIGARLAAAFPDSNRGKTFVATPLREQLVGPVRTTLYMLLGAVALVLLIACANVANLLLARATSRTREIAVRIALGASRWRVVRQLMIESASLALIGGALGALLARFGTDALVRIAARNLPRINEVRVDWTVLAFAAAVAILTSFLFGLAPAWQASRADVHDALKAGGSRGIVGRGSNRLRAALVVAEIALSFALAIGAGLLFRSFISLNSVQLGYRTEGILVMYAHAPARGLNEYLQAGHFFEQLLAELRAIPGVISAGAAMGVPAGQYESNGSYAIEGKHVFKPGEKLPDAGFRLAMPGYFSTMGIPLLRGRDFNERDQYDSPFVVIVSNAVVQAEFRGEDPIGRRIQCGLDTDKWMTIVGVVGDVRQHSPASALAQELYLAGTQHPFHDNELQVVMHTAGAPSSLIPAVSRKVQELNPNVAMKFTTMDAAISDSIATPRFRTFLVGLFAALALLLAMIGVYGVMSYITAQRTPELGLRMALGAQRSNILGLILGRAMALAAAGLAFGLALSVAAGRVLASMLFGITSADSLTYAAAFVAIAAITFAAAALPAWRATRINPVIALREE